MRPLVTNLALILLCLSVSSLASAQATVNESLETKTFYVNGTTGSDNNPGTVAEPFQTINKAAAVAISHKNNGVGSKVLISPGLYREAIILNGRPKQSALPITFQAVTNGSVTITGATEVKGWVPDSQNKNLYTASWPNRWGFCQRDQSPLLEQPIVLRREMIFVNGAPLTQVLSLSQLVYPGTFMVDENAGEVYIWPPTATSMTTADIEVATNPTLLTIQGSGTSLNGIVIRGINFQYANTCYNEPAVLVQGMASNILFDSDTFVWNNGQGLAVNHPAANITIENSTSNHNGSTGFEGFQAKSMLFQNIEASYNNWRGAQGGYYYWSAAGAHIFSDHDETMTGFTAKYNQTYSVHWDTDTQNIAVSSLSSVGNMTGPLFEKSEGPLAVSGSQFCSSQSQHAGYAGFIIRNAKNVNLTGNTFYSNVGSQVLITGIAGGVPITNWETGQVYDLITKSLTFKHNTVEGGAEQQVFADGYLGGSDWTQFVTTLQSDNNTWWNSASTNAFTVPTPKAGTSVNFAKWQTETSQDLDSKWSAPSGNPATACSAVADRPDFWLTVTVDEVSTTSAGQAVFDLAIMQLGGLTGAITLKTEGISSIPGASASFSPSKVSTSGASVLTVNTGSKTPAGTYTFTVLANTGSITRALTLSFTKN